MARDGATILEDTNLFGQEWQVLESEPKLFQAPSSHLGACVPPTVDSRRRLAEASIDQEAAEMACAHFEDPVRKDMCVFDVMAMEDLEVAHAHRAF